MIGVWAFKFTPYVGIERDLTLEKLVTSPLARGLVLDITGTERLHHGEALLIRSIQNTLRKKEIPVSLAIAPTVGGAWALSRFRRNGPSIIAKERLRDALSGLPVEALRIPDKVTSSLREVGLISIGDLLLLPPKSIALRFGIELLQRIDQALGHVEEPIRLLKVREKVRIVRQFEYPLIRHESVRSALLKMLEEILQKLASRSLRAGSFVITINNTSSKELSLFSASNNLSHIASVLEPTIESIQSKDGISLLALSACNLEHASVQQVVLDRSLQQARDARGELFNNLIAKLGDSRVQKVAFHSSYIPERSFTFVPLRATDPLSCPLYIKERPSRIFPVPEPIQAIAMLPDRPPSWFRWRGGEYRTLQGLGPERIASEWWKDGLSEAMTARDYFKIQDHIGRWIWIFRDNTFQWYAHGIWS